MNESFRAEQNDVVLKFMSLARKKFENGSFFKLYKLLFSHLRASEEDMTVENASVAFCIEIFEHVLTKDTKCPNCKTHYKFRHIVTDKGWHCIEIDCDSCGDFIHYSEENESEIYFNIKVISKIESYKRRGKGLKIGTFRGDHTQMASLTWEVENELPTLWININQTRRADEVEALWQKSKKEVQKRNRLAKRATG